MTTTVEDPKNWDFNSNRRSFQLEVFASIATKKQEWQLPPWAPQFGRPCVRLISNLDYPSFLKLWRQWLKVSEVRQAPSPLAAKRPHFLESSQKYVQILKSPQSLEEMISISYGSTGCRVFKQGIQN